ncbi:hypothetical protein [Rhizobium herbae]
MTPHVKSLPALLLAAWSCIPGAALADVNTRYGELQAVIDAINDPDPVMRLAQLEEILQRGNATEVQLAIRTAFSVDDPNVRSLALRAHFAGFRTFIVTAALPPQIQQIMHSKDEKTKAATAEQHSRLFDFLSTHGYQFAFQSEYPTKDQLEFTVKALNAAPEAERADDYSGAGNIRGGMINIASLVRNTPGNTSATSCSFEFDGYDAFTLKGTGACNMEGGFPFPVTLRLFDDDKPAQ